MKISKILMGAAALTGALILGGCRQNEDPHGILNIKGDTASINYTNEDTGITHRGFNTLKTKHTDAVAVITIDTKESKANETTNKAGVFGFIFDLNKTTAKDSNEEERKSYDFTSVAVRYYGSSLQTYVSRFSGVCPDYLDGENNFKDVNGVELTSKANETSKAIETEYLKGSSGAYATIEGVSPDDDGKIKVAIEVVANKDGTYSIAYYKADDLADSAKEDDGTQTGQIKLGSTPLTVKGNKTLDSGKLSVDASWKEGATDTKQTDMGFYAAVYPSSTLVGEIKLPYILNEGEVAEWYE